MDSNLFFSFYEKTLLISLTALAVLGVTTATTLYAQTTTGGSVITRMKAAAAAFTLTADLNPGQTGLTSAPLVGKKTGDILTAGEYNRLLELISEGNGTGGSLQISFKKDYSKDGNSTVPAIENIGSHDFCALTRYGEGQTSDSTAGYCKVEKGTDGTWTASIQALNNNINCQVTCFKGNGSSSNIIKGSTGVGFLNGQSHSSPVTVSFGRECLNPIITVQSVLDSIACGTGSGPANCTADPGQNSQDLHAYFSNVTTTGFQTYLSSTSGVWVGAVSPSFGINYIVACD